ncbi:MAG TPA: hypothetical protein VL221_04980 [Bacteroidota bacterium]|nr:hypothetical protein [Bacteroidota bacterium]
MAISRRVVKVAVILVGVLTPLCPAVAQDSILAQQPHGQAFPQRVITSVPFNGMRYFIAIAPLDTMNIDHMPIAGRPPAWKGSRPDSAWHLPPDSLLRRFQHRGVEPR